MVGIIIKVVEFRSDREEGEKQFLSVCCVPGIVLGS